MYFVRVFCLVICIIFFDFMKCLMWKLQINVIWRDLEWLSIFWGTCIEHVNKKLSFICFTDGNMSLESIRNGWSCNQKAGRGNTRGKYNRESTTNKDVSNLDEVATLYWQRHYILNKVAVSERKYKIYLSMTQ